VVRIATTEIRNVMAVMTIMQGIVEETMVKVTAVEMGKTKMDITVDRGVQEVQNKIEEMAMEAEVVQGKKREAIQIRTSRKTIGHLKILGQGIGQKKLRKPSKSLILE
jgi:hypothetical protein